MRGVGSEVTGTSEFEFSKGQGIELTIWKLKGGIKFSLFGPRNMQLFVVRRFHGIIENSMLSGKLNRRHDSFKDVACVWAYRWHLC